MSRFASSVMNFLMQSTKVTAVTFFTLNYIGGFVVCYGPSMEPTLRTGDILLTDHISPLMEKIDIGDVVVARSPHDNRCVCKRVVAGPGDIVLFNNETITIPKESVWLEGDNKGNSSDSRFYGPVPYSMIRRRCFCKIWPQLVLNLGASEMLYLESNPPTKQKTHHRENERQQQLQLLSRDLLESKKEGEGNNNGKFDIANDGTDEKFPMEKPNNNAPTAPLRENENNNNFMSRVTQEESPLNAVDTVKKTYFKERESEFIGQIRSKALQELRFFYVRSQSTGSQKRENVAFCGGCSAARNTEDYHIVLSQEQATHHLSSRAVMTRIKTMVYNISDIYRNGNNDVAVVRNDKDNMIASDCDYSSDESLSLPDSELVQPEVSSSNQSKHDSSDSSNKESLLKRAIKDNENSIIQSILSPPPVSSLLSRNSSSNTNKSSNSSNSSTDKTTSTITESEGLSPLLDYLFEDGQLTRTEYDLVDKRHGMSSAVEQAQMMLRILMESKSDGALEILLECLSRLDPTSETIRKLCTQFLPAIEERTERVVFRNEVKLKEIAKQTSLVNRHSGEQRNRKARVHLELSSFFGDNSSSRKLHDFYYGRRQIHNSSRERLVERDNDYDDKEKRNADRKWNTATQQQMNKTLLDFTDFYLTNGCLETIRNLILDNCEEATTAVGWEKVLRNMNGLLSTDVLSIKDLLFQIRTLDHELALEEEARVAKGVRKIHRERRKLRQPNILEKQKREKVHIIGGKDNQNEEALRKSDDPDRKVSSTARGIENKHGRNINWNQVIYHSFQVWKQRNGVNSTFYSLIGIFQHSKLYQTADLLLECKNEIQLRENEKDITGGSAFDVNNGTSKVSTTSTMLEKSDFLRKFYSPSRRSDNNNGNFQSVGLTATKDRVSASPVLSLDLL